MSSCRSSGESFGHSRDQWSSAPQWKQLLRPLAFTLTLGASVPSPFPSHFPLSALPAVRAVPLPCRAVPALLRPHLPECDALLVGLGRAQQLLIPRAPLEPEGTADHVVLCLGHGVLAGQEVVVDLALELAVELVI